MNHQDNHIEDPKVPYGEVLRSGDSFKVPERYFDGLTNRIMDRVERHVVPSGLKEEIFKIPDGYFENFTGRLMTKIKPQKTSKIIRTGFNRVWAYSAAAVIVIAVSWFVISLFKNTETDYFATITEEELFEYVSNYSDQFDQNTLASVMTEEEINSLEILDEMDDETSDMLIEMYE